jgi:hypothetical protein
VRPEAELIEMGTAERVNIPQSDVTGITEMLAAEERYSIGQHGSGDTQERLL